MTCIPTSLNILQDNYVFGGSVWMDLTYSTQGIFGVDGIKVYRYEIHYRSRHTPKHAITLSTIGNLCLDMTVNTNE